MREISYREIQLVRVFLKGFCPRCAARRVKARLVDDPESGARDQCSCCHEVWPKERIHREFFEEMTYSDFLEFSRSLVKIPDGILND